MHEAKKLGQIVAGAIVAGVGSAKLKKIGKTFVKQGVPLAKVILKRIV